MLLRAIFWLFEQASRKLEACATGFTDYITG